LGAAARLPATSGNFGALQRPSQANSYASFHWRILSWSGPAGRPDRSNSVQTGLSAQQWRSAGCLRCRCGSAQHVHQSEPNRCDPHGVPFNARAVSEIGLLRAPSDPSALPGDLNTGRTVSLITEADNKDDAMGENPAGSSRGLLCYNGESASAEVISDKNAKTAPQCSDDA
jgi:hypothetical protein